MFIRTLTSKYILSLIKYTGCVLILACLVAVQGVAQDPVDSPTTQTILNLSGVDPINLGNEGKEIILTLTNTEDTTYSGIISALYETDWGETLLNTSAKVIITTTNQNSSTLTLNPDYTYADFAGSVTVEGANSSHAEGVLNLASPNIFSPLVDDSRDSHAPTITNNGTIIINANQVFPNLDGSGNIQINGNYTLTLANTKDTNYEGNISGAGHIIITKPRWDTGAQLKLSKEGGYTDFTGSVTIQAAGSTPEDSHAEGVLLTTANIFCNASSITNDGTLIVSANQVLPNLRGDASAKIKISSGVNTLTFNNTDDTDYAGNITVADGTDVWSGNIIKKGNGELTLSHSSRFTVDNVSITVEEGALKITTATNIFNTPSVTINRGGKISASRNQLFKNLKGSGDIEILNGADVDSIYDQDAEISGRIYGNGEFEKQGKGTLTLSGANALTGYIKIDDGKIIFMGDAIEFNEKIEGNVVSGTNRKTGEVEFYTEGTKFICIPNDSKHILVKSIEKTGDSDSVLRIYEGATGCVRAESFVISSGRLDYGGYFQSLPPEGVDLGIFDVKGGTTFSPGVTINDQGEFVDTIGRMTISNEARLKIEENALALFEFDAYNETGLKFDNVVFEHENSTFVAADSTIDLDFLNNDVSEWAKEGAEYWIVNDHGYKDKDGNPIPEGVSVDFNNLLRDKYKDYFSLVGRYNGLYLIGKGAPEPPSHLVPEPSSWILLLGSMVTFLMYLRKKQG